MAKYDLRIKARELRNQGVSVKKIAQDLEVAKSSVSLWVRGIPLTPEQLRRLKNNEIRGAELGRIRSAAKKNEQRRQRVEEAKAYGDKKLANLLDREFLIAGLALYWGEGSRKKIEVSFCNSDPKMIKFLIIWLQTFFAVSKEDLRFCIGINEIHREREGVVKDYWSKMLGFSLSQFNETSFKKVENKKVYTNFNEHFGTLRVRVLRSVSLHYSIIGLIEGLKTNTPG